MYHFHLNRQFENTLNKPRNTWIIIELIYSYFFSKKTFPFRGTMLLLISKHTSNLSKKKLPNFKTYQDIPVPQRILPNCQSNKSPKTVHNKNNTSIIELVTKFQCCTSPRSRIFTIKQLSKN